MQSITEIMRDHPDRLGRIALQSTMSSSRKAATIFIPWAYYPEGDIWVGVSRWKGNNNRSVDVATMNGSRKGWFIYREKWPILPKNHPLRKGLDKDKRLHEYRMSRNGLV